MENDKEKKVTRKAKKQTQRKTRPTRARQTSEDPSPRTPPPLPPSGATAATAATEPAKIALHPAVSLIVSLLAPGLGLLLLERKDRVKDAFLIFGLWFAYVSLSFFLTFFVIGVCCWLPLPLLNVAAGIHSFDEMTLEQGGRPVLFQTSFRIFQE
jgi:hypothetical protein